MSSLTNINSTDLITNSRADINGNFSTLNTDKEEVSNKSTDSTFASADDTTYPTTLATKKYVDAGGNVNASTTGKGIVELATSAEINAGSATGGTGAALVVTPDALKASQVPIIQKYLTADSPATWTKPAGLKFVIVEVQGAGGNGGGDTGGGTGGAGGGGGGYSRKVIAAASLGTTETVTIGAGGVGSGNTSFGAHATGANGGNASTSTAGTAGSAASGDVNIAGQVGGGESTAPSGFGGPGGNSVLGFGAPVTLNGSATANKNGAAAAGYGGGGAGGACASDGSPASSSGGAGAPGIVIVTEYYS